MRKQINCLPLVLGTWLLFISGGTLAQPATSSVRADGTLLLNNQPYFPFGFYHVSWVNDRKGKSLRNDLIDNADNGVNFMHPNLDADARAERLLDIAEQQGVSIGVELHWPTRKQIVRGLKGHPAIWGWTIGDDVNLPGNKPPYPPAVLRARHQEIKALDPNHVTYASAVGAPELEIEAYVKNRSVDVLGIQSYPVGNGIPDGKVLKENIRYYAHVHQSIQNHGRVALVANLQTFAWPQERYPTRQETRNLLYGALMHGVKGVMAYAYYDGGKTLKERQPALWKELGALRQEVALLAPALMNGTRRLLSTGTEGVYAARWDYRGEAWIMVLSADQSNAQTVSLPMDAPGSSALETVFANRPRGMTLTQGRLSGTIQPADVHLYKITAAPPPTDVLADGVYELHPVSAPTKVLEVNLAQGNGDNVQQATDQNTARQRWRLNKLANGYYRLTSGAEATQCLDVRRRGTSPGTSVQTWRVNPNGQSNQEWRITLEDEALGYYRLAPRHTEEQGLRRSLDVAGASQADGANLQLWNSNGTKAQRFVLEKVGEASVRTATNESAHDGDEVTFSTVRVYPNPSRGSFTVDGIPTKGSQINLYDLQGRSIPVRQQIVNQHQLRIQPQGAVSEGLYILRVQTTEGVTAQYRLSVQPSATEE